MHTLLVTTALSPLARAQGTQIDKRLCFPITDKVRINIYGIGFRTWENSCSHLKLGAHDHEGFCCEVLPPVSREFVHDLSGERRDKNLFEAVHHSKRSTATDTTGAYHVTTRIKHDCLRLMSIFRPIAVDEEELSFDMGDVILFVKFY